MTLCNYLLHYVSYLQQLGLLSYKVHLSSFLALPVVSSHKAVTVPNNNAQHTHTHLCHTTFMGVLSYFSDAYGPYNPDDNPFLLQTTFLKLWSVLFTLQPRWQPFLIRNHIFLLWSIPFPLWHNL